MEIERVDLRAFLGDSLELLGLIIPDRIVFTCQFDETPDVQVDRRRLHEVVAQLVAAACEAVDDGVSEVRLRTGTVAGKSGPHAFIEVSRPETGTRIVVPIPVFQATEVRLAGIEPATSRSGGARSIP
jgi:signal transduction histidine kinase